VKKHIRKIKPPKKPDVTWSVNFRHTRTGVCVDIERYETTDVLNYKVDRQSYLISREQLVAWSKDPETYRGKWTFKVGK